jgi:flagellar hook assembly protein FlgD
VTVSPRERGRRTPLISRIVFGGLVVATLAAFFISQHLKVTTPFITGVSPPTPAAIDPVGGPMACRSTKVSFSLLHHVDNVDVYVVNQSDVTVRDLARGLFMRKKETRTFTWDGRNDRGQRAPPGSYFFRVYLIHQARSIQIPQPVRVTSLATCSSKH